MVGHWFFRPERNTWSLIANGVEEITITSERLAQTCAANGLTRREALEWIGTRPKAPYSKVAA